MPKRILVDKATIRNRIFIVFVVLTFIIALLFYKLFSVMIMKSTKYKKMAQEQWTSEVKISAKRGRILDRNGEEFAISGNVYRVDLDLNTIKNSLAEKNMKMDELADKLSAALGMEKKDVEKQLNKRFKDGRPMGSAILARRVDKSRTDKVLAINVKGVMVSPDTKRYYPYGNFLSQVLGHTNSDGNGLTGVELEYDKYLKGMPGVRKAEIDKNSANLPYTISEYSKPLDGRDVELTIDKNMQCFAEKYAQEALVNNKAKAVSIVIMNPKNGEILAMANKPDYDLNDPWDKSKNYNELQKSWRNRAVSDAFEPGSIFKVVTASTAMSLGVVHENDKFNCPGSITIAKRTIHCWKRTGHGEETFPDILKNSCNVGFAELGQKIGAENLNNYINKFGFGKKTGIDLPGEAKGIIRPTNKIGPVDLATIAFGQSNTVSMIQYMQAFNCVANGGNLITPHVMKEISHVDNNKQVVDKEYNDYNKKRILDESMTATLRGYLERVVSEGGGKNAFIDGYHIAGKTGTAQKPNPNGGGYEHGKYISSFVGMAPANDPRVTVMISIDEPDPSNYYAAQTAAPVGQKVFNEIFNYLGMKPDVSSSDAAKSMLKDVVIPNLRGMKKDDAVKELKNLNIEADIDGAGEYVENTTPIPGINVKEGTKVILYTGDSTNYNNNDVIVPDLIGCSRQEAEQTLKSLGLDFKITGDGVVEKQSITAGKQVNKSTVITINLGDISD